MGMDILDLTFRLESKFDVEITSSDWAELAKDGDCTVQELYELLLTRQEQQQLARRNVSVNAEVWRKTRQAIATIRGISNESLTLATPLAEVFGQHVNPKDWRRLEQETAYHWPRLIWPSMTLAGLWVVTLFFLVTFMSRFSLAIFLLQVAVYAILLALGLSLAREKYRNRIPPHLNTLKELCRKIRDMNLSSIELPHLAADRATPQHWRKLQACLVDALGVDADEITPHARLVADLGCN